MMLNATSPNTRSKRGVAFATMLLFVALSLVAAGPHPFDDDFGPCPGVGPQIAHTAHHSDIPCPLCDWVANANAAPVLPVPVVAAPSVEPLLHFQVVLSAHTFSLPQPVGRAPPVCFA
jgi:hypothetical protein